MILLPITVRNKIATFTGDVPYICGNSDYKAVFTFDDEWDEHSHKTARFVYGSSYTDVLFEGNECSFPMIEETTMVVVGVYAGNLRTTTGASVRAILSIRSEHGSPESPKPDVYEQIMETLDGYDDRLEDVEKKLSSGGGGKDKYVSDYRIETIGFPGREYIVLIYNDGSEMQIELPQMGIDIDDVIQFGTSDPTGNTSGATKQLYINTSTGKMWVCKNGLMRPVQWISLSGGENTGGGITKDELASAVDDALREAKESGSFDGKDGKDGKDGVTPHIGANGNWFIGSTDTGVRAKGVDGKDGTNGKDGKTPVKGTDYFTAADKEELVAAVIAGLPVYDGEAVIL